MICHRARFLSILASLLVLLLADAIAELCLIGTTVAWLSGVEDHHFPLHVANRTVHVRALPASLSVAGGHLANAVAGSLIVLISGAGLLLMYRRALQGCNVAEGPLWFVWLALSACTGILAIVALGLNVFAITKTGGPHPSDETVLDRASDDLPFIGDWTLYGWLCWLLSQPLASDHYRESIRTRVLVVQAFTWNLIPLVLLVLLVLLCSLKVRRAKQLQNPAVSF